MRRKDETLRETLLEFAHKITDEYGANALNIRALATRAGVSSGTVYNYFSGKDEILLALTEEYWAKALAEMRGAIGPGSFTTQLFEIYVFLKAKIGKSAGMLMDSLQNVEAMGRERMQSMQQILLMDIMERMQKDKKIRADIWDEALSAEQFAAFIVAHMMALLRMNASGIAPFVEIVERILY